MTNERRVLITGAAGRIGTFLRKAWDGRYDLVVMDRKEIPDPGAARAVVGDIRDVEFMRSACDGVATVVHLAANPNPGSDFDSVVLPMNIIGTHNTYRAAAEAGVKRVIFASSIHAVGAYPPDVQVKWDMPVRPCCEYGASKCYGEALGRYFSDRRGISFIAIRIGAAHGHDGEAKHHNTRMMDFGISYEDLTQLITLCVEAPEDLRFAILHGLSDNAFKRLDISLARELLGYHPTDDASEQVGDLEIPEPQPVHPG